MQILLCFTISNFIIFTPLICGFYGVADYLQKKLYFSITLFGIIVFGGYCTFKGLKTYIHVSNKKTFIFDIEKFLIKDKKSFKLQGLEVYCFVFQTRCSFDNCTLIKLISIFNLISLNIFPIIKTKKNFLKMKNDITIVSNREVSTYIKTGFYLNLFCIINIILKGVVKKIINYVRAK